MVTKEEKKLYKEEAKRLKKQLRGSKRKEIKKALKKVPELESKKLPEKKVISARNKEYRKSASRLWKILEPLWFMNIKKQKAVKYFKKKKK